MHDWHCRKFRKSVEDTEFVYSMIPYNRDASIDFKDEKSKLIQLSTEVAFLYFSFGIDRKTKPNRSSFYILSDI